MRIPLAWLNLMHSKTRTALAAAGVAFAVVLIFMQLGFLGAAKQSATLVFDAMDFDLLLRSRHYLHLVASRTFPRSRLDQAKSLTGVAGVSPVYITNDYWRNPHDGSRRAMLILGVPTDEPVFRVPSIQNELARLRVPRFVLVDEKSRSEFGPADRRRFGEADVGVETEIGRQRVRGLGLVADGAVPTSLRGIARLRPQQAPENVSLGLVRLRPGADAAAAAAELRKMLHDDVEILTRDEVLRAEVRHWVWETSIGLIFQLGVLVALVVGTAVVYQVLSSDVANHLPEYATLKAMGYSGNFLASVVMQQAVALAVLGFLPGLAVAFVLYQLTGAAARIPIAMPPGRVLLVLVLAVLMCSISGLGALRKVRSADPADLF